MKRTIEMDLEYLNYIPKPPQSTEEMWGRATSNDTITVNSWRKIWYEQTLANHKKYGPFKDRGIGKFFGKFNQRPCILVGSGPSLKNNVHELKKKGDIPVISCLHNFHYMIDNEIDVDFYVNLDAGKVTLEEISEGGQKDHQYYVDKSEGKILFTFIGAHPELLASWKGEIYFFTCPIPDKELTDQIESIENFHTYVSTGGNVLGASMYIAKAILGCNPIAFTGADFCFSYDKKYHPWKSKYDDNVGEALRSIDVFGNKVLCWSSYFNFKTWFDYIAVNIAGIYVNCTEGGMMGAYPEGNIMQIKQMPLKDFIWMYTMYKEMKEQCDNPGLKDYKILF